MKINKEIFNLSAWLALLTIFIIPGKVSIVGIQMTQYGYPFRFISLFNTSTHMDKWLIKDINVLLLYYFFDVIIIYWIILGVMFIKNKIR
ncbi:hypothetical protein J23TS9_45200 [Paenibacillus sp. J23TS9]|uniref:hypothetical protein n=1 Tax=Paenibacillus sp. J23TS9 TaxID=2807193 RepID=UPI001B1330B5|nr:hypothetical protein [Paenibacillus sp. J23TS9]GIP29390.1 hypothetical protein J23TS9_45200 [Paenibacillus sp. J23TS9]